MDGVSNTPSTKPLPDESNRADIELMLLHAFEFWVSDQDSNVKPMQMTIQSSSAAGRTIHTLDLVEVNPQAGAG